MNVILKENSNVKTNEIAIIVQDFNKDSKIVQIHHNRTKIEKKVYIIECKDAKQKHHLFFFLEIAKETKEPFNIQNLIKIANWEVDSLTSTSIEIFNAKPKDKRKLAINYIINALNNKKSA